MNYLRVIGFSWYALTALGGCAQSPERDIRPATDSGPLDRGFDISVDTSWDRGLDSSFSPDTNDPDEDATSPADANLCDGNLRSCSGECVNINTNIDHCGRCGNDCGAFHRCVGGDCICTDTRRC